MDSSAENNKIIVSTQHYPPSFIRHVLQLFRIQLEPMPGNIDLLLASSLSFSLFLSSWATFVGLLIFNYCPRNVCRMIVL